MSDIVVNTNLMRSYASRLNAVNNRLLELDKNLDQLYWKVGLQGLLELINADLIVGYNNSLNRCRLYLENTASAFELSENRISNIDIKTFDGINSEENFSLIAAPGSGFGGGFSIAAGFGGGGGFRDSDEVDHKTEREKMSDIMEYLGGAWVDETFPDLPREIRESGKKSIKKLADEAFGKNFSASWEITEKMMSGDYIGGVKKALKTIYKKDEKNIFQYLDNLKTQYVINTICGTAEQYTKYAKKPSITTLVGIGWAPVGSVLETAGDAAWNLADTYIPGVTNWYDAQGATNASEAFNCAYKEWTRLAFGDETAEYVGSYYAKNGGLFEGLANGVKTVAESTKESGGLWEAWKNGWHSMFS